MMSTINPKYDKFCTVNINTLKGIKQAERLHQSEQWEQITVGFNTIKYGRLRPIKETHHVSEHK
jgi:hypothetical protein